MPVAYGGQGLSPAHQRAFNEELAGYEHASRVQVPTMTPCLAVLLDFGTEEQKQRHVPAILKGEEIWMQLLSEPSGGSDVAGALTSAVRDGDEWILNGSKVWTTGAWWSDWGLCLARTNWDVPKHRGLTVFILPLHQENVEIQQIELLNGSREFCQEFLTDVRVPDGDRIGEVDDGWTVGTRWMFHERMLHNSPLVTVPAGKGGGHGPHSAQTVLDVARDAGRLDDRRTRELIGEARTLELVLEHLRHRVGQGVITRQDARPVRGGRPPVPRHLARAASTPSPTRWPAASARCGPTRTARPPRPATRSSCASRPASAAAPPRWRATWSASGSSACPGSAPPTVTWPSARFHAARPRTADRPSPGRAARPDPAARLG